MAKKKAAKGARAVKAKASKKAVARKKKVRPVKAVASRFVAVKKAIPKKGFTKDELEHFRGIILEKRKQIIEELELMNETLNDNSGGDYFEENSPYSLHMEQGTDTMEKEKNYLLAARQRKFLEYLDDAIKRIDRRVYGFCQDCGKLIDKARLEAVPHAQLCISCKMKRGQ
ncbi:MAG TPA: TraR/DksA family transcriptional regulator [Candidatus Acidoferrales bacterium]|nr:TraR/DksA family transcriptional regulator [Candidatus Acidoferrales bacterium]